MDRLRALTGWSGGIWTFGTTLVCAAFIPTVVLFYARRSLYRKKEARAKVGLKEFEKDLVYLHMFPRKVAKQVPNMSPFAMKLEMWLRIKNIRHQIVETLVWSKKRQSPYIILNGEEIADTNCIIARLIVHFNLDATEGLDEETLGVSRAFLHLVEGSFVWSYFLWRYTEHPNEFAKVFNIPLWSPLAKLIRRNMAKGMRKRCTEVGFARHSDSERKNIAEADLTAISRYLGNKQYMCGDQPTTVDCSLFGHLSQVVYVKSLNYPQRTFIESSCPNILDYLNRIKSNYWKDWDEITNLGEFDM